MKKLQFNFNLFFTSIALILIIVNFIFNTNDQANIIILLFLGFFQVFTSFVLTIISIFENKKILALFIIYWILVIVFFKFIFRDYFYSCILVAFYNLYINYCSSSNSKYNITKL